MEPIRRALVLAVVLPMAAMSVSGTRAAAETATDAQRAVARDWLGRAEQAYASGDVDGALRAARKSRAASGTAKAALLAATCLARLARLDEALDMYEEASHAPSEVGDAERAAIAHALTTLGPRAGFLQVAARVHGALVVDGIARAALPLTTPLHALAGAHRVRVVADGYEVFEETIEVRSGEVASVDARLVPLSLAGRLRVEGNAAATVIVDGAPRGLAPWEGALAPGDHAVWLEGDDAGSAPARAVVRVGEVTTMRATSAPLGAAVRVEVEPATAHLTIDGVDVGPGSWLGRAPIGAHALRAIEDGYTPASATLTSTAGGAPAPIRITLAVDPTSPHWPKPSHAVAFGLVRLSLHGGYARAGSMRSDAEDLCRASCVSSTRVDGALLGARGALVFGSGLGLDLDLGFLSLGNRLTRPQAGYLFYDDVLFHGPYASLGASWERGIRTSLPFALGVVSRVGLGGVFAQSTDDVSGGALVNNRLRASTIARAGESVGSFAPFVLPSLGVTGRWHGFYGALTVGAFFVTQRGPALPTGAVTTRGFPPSNVIAGERAYGPFVLWLPQLEVGYEL